jgi:UTP--glucose-1-phosphate uridylyltransferase
MLPATRAVPKELLPIGSTPAIHWVLEEAAAAGIEEAVVVVSPDKPLIAKYLETSALADALGVSLRFVTQEAPRGLADAIWQCREVVADQPFALLLPDNVVLSGSAGFRAMLDLNARDGRDVLGALRLDSRWSGQFGHSGLIDFEEREGGVLEITRLGDKRPGRLEIAPDRTVVRTCGRFVCTPDVVAGIERLRGAETGELDEVPVLQEIIGRRGACGIILPPPLFDVGSPHGFAAANAAWLERQRDELRQ